MMVRLNAFAAKVLVNACCPSGGRASLLGPIELAQQVGVSGKDFGHDDTALGIRPLLIRERGDVELLRIRQLTRRLERFAHAEQRLGRERMPGADAALEARENLLELGPCPRV